MLIIDLQMYQLTVLQSVKKCQFHAASLSDDHEGNYGHKLCYFVTDIIYTNIKLIKQAFYSEDYESIM